MASRGHKSSEYRMTAVAFGCNMIFGVYALYSGADLSATAVLLGAIDLPVMTYIGARTTLKRKTGEDI